MTSNSIKHAYHNHYQIKLPEISIIFMKPLKKSREIRALMGTGAHLHKIKTYISNPEKKTSILNRVA